MAGQQKHFKVAFTFQNRSTFHEGVETVRNCADATSAEKWFRANRPAPFYSVDSVWEA